MKIVQAFLKNENNGLQDILGTSIISENEKEIITNWRKQIYFAFVRR